MQTPDILSDLASVSGRSGSGTNGKGGEGKGADGSGFGDLHQSLLGGGAGSSGLKPGDTLRNAEGNVIGRIVRGDDGGLSLALQGHEGEGIPLEQLASLLDEQEGSGLEALQALFSGELQLEAGTEQAGADWLQKLENLSGEEQQGVLTALAGLSGLRANKGGTEAGTDGGNRLPLAEILGQSGVGQGGDNGSGSRNGTSNFLQNLLSGMALNGQNAQSGDASSSDLRFEGLRLVAVESSGGQDSGNSSSSRGGEVAGLTQQAFTRGEAGRDVSLRQYTTTVETPVQQQKQWSEQVAGKIAWLAGRSIQSADIQLNPPDMGPIEVRVSVQNDQAQVTVNAQNSQVREMLELNSSRLRDMLEQEGLNLSGFDVSGEAPGGEREEAGDEGNTAGGDAGLANEDGESVSAGEVAIGLDDSIDTYA
ncbi:MAG: flagellar hook-length control protein FliK [Pseudomonadota bacterium]